MWIFLWIALSIAVGYAAKNKARNFWDWLIISLLFSPLVSAVFLWTRKDLTEGQALKRGELKKCLYCSEIIKQEAIKCKHCGANLPAIS